MVGFLASRTQNFGKSVFGHFLALGKQSSDRQSAKITNPSLWVKLLEKVEYVLCVALHITSRSLDHEAAFRQVSPLVGKFKQTDLPSHLFLEIRKNSREVKQKIAGR